MRATFLPWLISASLLAQDPPALRALTRIDGGLGGLLVFADGTQRELDRTAELRRRNLGAAADRDSQLRTLEDELRKYREQFHKSAAGK